MNPKQNIRFFLGSIFMLGCVLLSGAGQAKLKAGDRIMLLGDSLLSVNCSNAVECYLLRSSGIPDLRLVSYNGFRTPEQAIKAFETEWKSFRPTHAFLLFGYQEFNTKKQDISKQQRFLDTLGKLSQKFASVGTKVVIVSPPPRSASMDYSGLSSAMKKNAAESGADFLDYNAAFRDLLQKAETKKISGLSPTGDSGVLAFLYSFLKYMNVSGEIAEITIDFKTMNLQVPEGQKLLEKTDRGNARLEGRRYSYCWNMWKKPSVFEILPFQDEYNRFIVKAVNVEDSATCKIQWGISRFSVTGKELKQGINLSKQKYANGNPFFMKTIQFNEMLFSKNRFLKTLIELGPSAEQKFKGWPNEQGLISAARKLNAVLPSGQDQAAQKLNKIHPVEYSLNYSAQ